MPSKLEVTPIELRIRQVIDDKVRPYIEMDGGGIEFVRFEDSVVYVRLSGACQGCPSSIITLKRGVEQAVCDNIPEVASVEMDGIAPLDAPAEGAIPVFQL
jgi:Fe-S cluster biogenesis protein NfuA